MKENLIEIIRSVPITDKTYSEYIEAVAERLLANERNVAREIIEILKETGIDKWLYPVIDEIEKKYTEGEG